MKTVPPYKFIERRTDEQTQQIKKGLPEAYHDRLNKDRFDIAFEIEWKTLTPTALNPCITTEKDAKGNPMPANIFGTKGEYAGYNNRWLMTGGKLAISSFTVKSAIANGFAAIMGGCLRVMDKDSGHSDVKQGIYPYGGAWKRYRVKMGSNSTPGIVKKLERKPNNKWDITIQPVLEYYYDSNVMPPGVTFTAGSPYLAKYNMVSNKRIIIDSSIKPFTGEKEDGYELLTYYGVYQFGMNLSLKPGQLGKNHYHRFYQIDPDPRRKEFSSVIDKENFDQNTQKKLVYMGAFKRMPPDRITEVRYKSLDSSLTNPKDKDELKRLYRIDEKKGGYKANNRIKNLPKGPDRFFKIFNSATWDYDPRKGNEGEIWFDDLNPAILADKWVYYEKFGGKVYIGKNFLFKALFYHPDTVPDGSEACTDMNHLCPRCSIFGMTNKDEKANKAVGFRGRFKGAVLVNNLPLKKEEYKTSIPVPQGEGQPPKMTEVVFQHWLNQSDPKDRVSHQILMPVMGPPKPNKRDVEGYFNPARGRAKGAKSYLHAKMNSQDLNDYIQKVDGDGEAQMGEYKHELRPVAQVCREELTFVGTVGAENCSVDEIAAFVVLLNSGMDGMKPHAFKLGLGKALGMGTVRSSISKVFIRKPDSYEWDCKDCRDGKLSAVIKELIPGIEKEFNIIKAVQEKLNLLEGMDDRKLQYPKAGLYYWKEFWNPDGGTAYQGRRDQVSGSGRQSHGGGGTHGGGFHNTIKFTQNKHKKR